MAHMARFGFVVPWSGCLDLLAPWVIAHSPASVHSTVPFGLPLSMPEMTHSRKGHRQIVGVCRRDHLRVPYRTPWLNCRSGASLRGRHQTVCEREECITADHTSFEQQARFPCLPHGNPACVHAAHLACANPQSPIGPCIQNGVGFNMLH